MTDSERFQLDPQLLRNTLERAAPSYDKAAVLQREIGSRLLERLDWIKLTPTAILDVGCATGLSTTDLFKRYRKARIVGLDLAPALLQIARDRTSWLRKLRCICSNATSIPLAESSCDLIFSNLALHWYSDLDQVFAEFQRVLKPGGLLIFSTLGPDTLIELRQSWAAADDYNHVHAFMDMHDIGDALVRGQFADPVMDAERITLTYTDAHSLMSDIKAIGAHNVSAGRSRSLTGKGRLQTMLDLYESWRQDGVLPATFEIVYGHAWKATHAKQRVNDDGVAFVPLDSLRRTRPNSAGNRG